MIAAILIGRKGSSGLPGKNTMPVLGRPLAAYAFMAARHAASVDAVYISTDDEALMEIGRGYGAEIIVRPPELCSKEALGEHAFLHAYHVVREREAAKGREVEMLALLMCNAPTILARTIDEGVAALRERPEVDSAVTVSRYNMWSPLRARREDADGLLQPFVPFETFGDPACLNCDRDSQGDVWFADMGLSLVRPRCLEDLDNGLLPQKWMGRKIFPLKQWGGCDIDYAWQVPEVAFWLEQHGFTTTRSPYGERAQDAASATANANFTTLGAGSAHDGHDAAYREYRRQWEENPRHFIVRDFPIHLDLEATNRCNLRCTFCDKLPVLTKDQIGDMDFGLFTRIIDEGREGGLCSIKLSYRGEPLLHPRLAEMVAYAKKSGLLDVYFNTNAMLLTETMAEALIDAGLDRISISAEGTDPAAYAAMRRGADFSRLLANVERLRAVRERRGVDHPRIRVQTVRLPEIDLAAYRRFWEPLADEVAALDFMDAAHREALVDPTFACPQLWQRMTVEVGGSVNPCNNDDFRRLSPGNARERSIRECWHDPAVALAREAHRQGQSHLLAACRDCVWRAAQIVKNRAARAAGAGA